MAFELKGGKELLRAVWFLSIIAVIAGSLLPSDSPAIQALDRLPVGDKVDHAVMYALLAFVPAIHERRGIVIAGAVGALALGIGLELAQLLVASRTFETGDIIADTTGVCMGLTSALVARIRTPGRNKP